MNAVALPLEKTPHELKIRQAAQLLAEAITPPSLWDKGLWRDLPITFEPGHYFLSIGAVTISADRQVKVSYYDPAAQIAEPGLVKSLYCHLSTSGLPKLTGLVGEEGELNRWLIKAGQYSQTSMEFLRSIMDELKAHKVMLNMDGDEKPGHTRMFPITIWSDALQTAGGHPWINNSWYHPPEFNPATHLWQLKCGAYIIRIAKSQRTLISSKKWHYRLRQKFTTDTLCKDLVIKQNELIVLSQEIGNRLAEFSNSIHLPGHCELF
jgi:hypothetical protein